MGRFLNVMRGAGRGIGLLHRPWLVTVTDANGKQKKRRFKSERAARAYIEKINANV